MLNAYLTFFFFCLLQHQITIAPKKENWDLKREIKPKLDRLEKQTQTAIAELVREKVQNETRAENS